MCRLFAKVTVVVVVVDDAEVTQAHWNVWMYIYELFGPGRSEMTV